jgi:hypothetical protein
MASNNKNRGYYFIKRLSFIKEKCLRKKLIYLILFSVTFGLYSIITYAEEDVVYISVDENGNISYSDKPPECETYETTEIEPIQTIKLENQTEIEKQLKLLSRSLNKNKKRRSTKEQDDNTESERYDIAIDKVEKQLKQRQTTKRFEQLKIKLDELREKKRKDC